MNVFARVWAAITTKSFGEDFARPGMGGGGEPRLRNPYRKSVWVQRAIKHVAGPIAAVSLKWTVDSRKGEVDYDEPAFAEFWDSPARGLTAYDWMEATVGWVKLRGESFWVLDDEWLRPFPDPRRQSKLIVARPDRMRHIVRDGVLEGWELRDAQGRAHLLLPEQVIQIKNWNPYDEWRGLGEMEAALIAAESDYFAGRFARDLAANNGDTGPFLVAKTGIPTEGQRDQIISQLREKRAYARRGEFRPVFLSGDITVEDARIRAPDANFAAQRLQNRHEIFIAMGVPPSMADVIASYSIGSASDRFRLIEETCMPLGAKIAEGAETLGRRLAGQPVFAWLDWDEHSTMQAVRRERVEAATRLWGMGMPAQAINDYLDMGMPKYPGWEVGYLPFSVMPAGEMTDPASDPEFSEDRSQRTEVRSRKVAGRLRAAFAARHRSKTDATAKQTEAERQLWRKHMRERREVEQSFERGFRRRLNEARRAVIAKIREHREEIDAAAGKERGAKSVEQKAAAADLVFDLEEWSEGLIATMRRNHERGIQKAGEQVFSEIDLDDAWRAPPARLRDFLLQRENLISGMADDIHAEVMASLDAGLMEGDTMEELAARVEAEFTGIGRARARTVARTETGHAYSNSRHWAMQEAGVPKKKWLTSGNPNVRHSHAEANGQVRDIDQLFDVGGEKLMHPGDPNGSPENIINCHCVEIAVREDES